MPTPAGITDTILRDAHQSLLATRMRTRDMLPIAAKLDDVGFHSLEVWGGATFDTCLRFLNEDPWERLRAAQGRLQAHPAADAAARPERGGLPPLRRRRGRALRRLAHENGIDIFRIFDALNDIRNMRTAMRAAKRDGGHVQATICYTISPSTASTAFVALGKELADMGADSICIKDMAGLITPYDAYELVGRLKAEVGLPVQLHCHYTSGMATVAYLKAAEAGVDVVDTAISTMSLASSQPPTESIVAALQGTPRDTGLDLELLSEIARYFAEVRKRYRAFEGDLVGVDTNVLTYQIPAA